MPAGRQSADRAIPKLTIPPVQQTKLAPAEQVTEFREGNVRRFTAPMGGMIRSQDGCI